MSATKAGKDLQDLVNLTDDLIRKNKLDELIERVSGENFLEYVSLSLSFDEIGDMSPERLGKIMFLFESGDIAASKEELFIRVTFSGDSKRLFQDLVAICLTYVMRDRLDPKTSSRIPKYQKTSGRKN